MSIRQSPGKQLRLEQVCVCVRHKYYPSQACFNVYLKKNVFNMYFVSLGLSCSMHSPFIAACGISFPDQGWNPGALHWEHRVLAIGPPGKSRNIYLKQNPRTNLVESLLLGLAPWKHLLCHSYCGWVRLSTSMGAHPSLLLIPAIFPWVPNSVFLQDNTCKSISLWCISNRDLKSLPLHPHAPPTTPIF